MASALSVFTGVLFWHFLNHDLTETPEIVMLPRATAAPTITYVSLIDTSVMCNFSPRLYARNSCSDLWMI